MERSCPLGLIRELSGRRDGVRSRKCTLVKEWLLENNYSLNCESRCSIQWVVECYLYFVQRSFVAVVDQQPTDSPEASFLHSFLTPFASL